MTRPAAHVRRGQLRVSVHSESSWLSQHLPFVVRDARNAFVTDGTVGEIAELDEGYYTVEVITPSGAPHREVVHVAADETSPLAIGVDSDTAPGVGLVGSTVPMPPMPQAEPPFMAEAGPSFTAEAEPRAADGGRPARLAGVRFCTATEDNGGWTFSPDIGLRDLPTASFLLDDDPHAWVISLPLNPAGTESDLRECHVRIERPDTGPAHPVASFSRRRRVSRMLDGVLLHHEVASATLLDQAAELLLSKYSDPPSAALGGLTLHRFGRLEERQDWVENLARDFSWLPDGQILCAALLMKDENPSERERGLNLLFSATVSRPLYTDGLSLASELLRRWPGEKWAEKREERLARLADYACTADWNAVMLTTQEDW